THIFQIMFLNSKPNTIASPWITTMKMSKRTTKRYFNYGHLIIHHMISSSIYMHCWDAICASLNRRDPGRIQEDQYGWYGTWKHQLMLIYSLFIIVLCLSKYR
ncbi:hypothetical protein ACJX0J_031599, partial [Zea mays]